MKEDNYVSDVGEANIEILKEDTAHTIDTMQEPGSKISAQPASYKNALLHVGMGMSRVVSTCYAAGKETIEMVLRNILPFMAFTATLLGMIQVSGLGNFIANSIAPLCATLPGMLLISLICSLPVVSPILGPGAVIAQVVGALLGTQIALEIYRRNMHYLHCSLSMRRLAATSYRLDYRCVRQKRKLLRQVYPPYYTAV